MGQRLLLVDSDRSFLKEHQVSLEAAFDVEVSGSLEGVLFRLESGDFAAVLICVEVADNKGYSLCSSIRKNIAFDRIKVVLISSKATEEEYRRHQSLKGRADAYLHKPIAPSALVAALAPLVPGRTLDPDNPFGELVDTELGDDWLDGLRSTLDPLGAGAGPGPGPSPADTPVFGVRPSSPVQTTNLDAKGDVPPDSRHVKLLEEQVAALHEELRLKDQRLAMADQHLQQAEAEAQQVQRQLNSVTLNLDELERSNREAETLKARLAATEAALQALEETRGREGESTEGLKAQLKEALTERTDLIQQVEALNHQVGDKSQRAIELLKERDRLQHEAMDLEPFRAKAKELEEALTTKGQELEATLARKDREQAATLAEKDEAMASLERVHDASLAEKDAALAALRQELEASVGAQQHLNTTIEGMVQQQATLEMLQQSTLAELTHQMEKIHSSQLEIAGLEATMRGQGRELAELGVRLKQVNAELESSRAELLAQEQLLATRQELIQQHQEEITQLTVRNAGVLKTLDEATAQHEGERLELMKGLDQRESEINRLTRVLGDQQEAHTALEQEKQTVHGQLSEHRDRLQNLDGLLQDIQDKLRRGSDLTRG